MELDRAACDRARRSRDARFDGRFFIGVTTTTAGINLKVFPHDTESYRFRLSYRPPYDWDAMLEFLAARATPGVESVETSSNHYR